MSINIHTPPPRSDAKAFLNYQIAVMLAVADGKPSEISSLSSDQWLPTSPASFNWAAYTYRITPPPAPKIAEGHNPGKFTEEFVGVAAGWRLLTEAEIKATQGPRRPDVEFCSGITPHWRNHSDYFDIEIRYKWTYRTKEPVGFFLPKPKIAEGHNPYKLTEEDVEVKDGWRLLTEAELRARNDRTKTHGPVYTTEIQVHLTVSGWSPSAVAAASVLNGLAYRTQKPAGYFLPKPKVLVQWTFETAPTPGTVLIRTKSISDMVFLGTSKSNTSFGGIVYTGLLSSYEHSLDGGKTWLPCGTWVEQA